MQRLLDFHSSQGLTSDTAQAELKVHLEEAEAAIKAAEAELAHLRGSLRRGPQLTVSRDVTIELRVPNPGPIALSITYLVKGASWTPSYDMRCAQ